MNKIKRQSSVRGGVSHAVAAPLAVVAFAMGHLSTTFQCKSWLDVNTGAAQQTNAIHMRNEKGWSTIYVFYGTTDHLEIQAAIRVVLGFLKLGRIWWCPACCITKPMVSLLTLPPMMRCI